MANTSERVLQLKKNFMEHHKNGWTIQEIADKYHVTRRHTYTLLQEIADENGVTRESLLEIPHSQHASPLFLHRDGVEKVNVEEIRKDFQNIISSANNVMKAIDTLLEEDVQ